MKLTILAVGQMRGHDAAALYAAYADKISKSGRQIALDGPHLIEIREQKDACEKLGAALDARKGAHIICLDETGRGLSSQAFADNLAGWRDNGIGELVFIIGPADGLNAALRARADTLISLGAMTWPHMLARVLLAEQIWRGISILTGHPYHRA